MQSQNYEEKLTDLIAALINWIDHEMPGTLVYGNMPLKESLERYFYFSATHHTSNLYPLLLASSGWRRATPHSSLTVLYDELIAISSLTKLLVRSSAYLKAVLRICKFTLSRSRFQLIGNEFQRIGFFAINARFVHFFSEYAKALGKEKVLFFCANSEAANTASALGYAVALEARDKLDIHKIKLSIMHPLFDAYWIALQNYLCLHGTITKYCPVTIVFAEGTSMQDQIAGWVARLEKIPTVRLQSGRGGILHSGYRNMAFDKMLCWGGGFVKRYQQYNPNPEYIITGNPSLTTSVERKTFNSSQVTCVIFTQPVNKSLSRTHYEALVTLTRRLLLKHVGMLVLVRKHPVDECKSFDLLAADYPDQIVLADYRTWSLKRVMGSADIAVGFYSTTLSESAASGVIPIILKLEDGHSVFPFPEKFGAAIEVLNIDAAIETINRLLKNPTKQLEIRQNMSSFASDFFGPQDGKAMERTVDNLLQTAGLN